MPTIRSGPNGPVVVPTFGERLRAARLRWGWDDRLRCWARILSSPSSPYRVELHPPGLVPTRSPKGEEYALWYGAADGPATLTNSAPALAALVGTEIKSPMVLWLDDDGRRVEVARL